MCAAKIRRVPKTTGTARRLIDPNPFQMLKTGATIDSGRNPIAGGACLGMLAGVEWSLEMAEFRDFYAFLRKL